MLSSVFVKNDDALAFQTQKRKKKQIDFESKSRYESTVYVDGANGVGAVKGRSLAQLLTAPSADDKCIHEHVSGAADGELITHHHRPAKYHLNLHLFNQDETAQDKLNYRVGSIDQTGLSTNKYLC